MALRTPPSIRVMVPKGYGFLAVSMAAFGPSGGRRCSAANLVMCSISSSSLDKRQEHETRKGGRATSCPVQDAEEIAARFGFEMAAAGLERLYGEHEHGDGPPAFSGPGSPDRRPLRVAYQGVRGSYSQEAAAAAFPSSAAAEDSCRLSFLACSHMEGAFTALEDGSADRAVVPMENSLDGPIYRNFDLLIRHPGFRIVGELLLPVDHCLLALPGATRSALRRVVSHPQALAHCRERVQHLGLEFEEVANAAFAAEMVAAEGIRDTAVIGSKIAAKEFGLLVMERNFQDQPAGANMNRFLQLAMDSGPVGGEGQRRKTTVAFSLEKGPSDLFRALWAFEGLGVQVSRVNHRPDRAKPVRLVEKTARMNYVFFLDVEGAEWDHRVKSGIERLHELAGFVRVLGCYACK
ncbi:hypothetical protein Cni_G11938 [Canna indica]|uniref:Prephenate dehydratase domain-containing protein n=1 Tax=Canna indica TaxID=4628 RepID=A0AAQ3K9R0_9LILI|nr:hypothetical protein Cni_G11938 [Canna indica]